MSWCCARGASLTGLSSARIWAGVPASKGWSASSSAGDRAALACWATGAGMKKLPGGFAAADDPAEGTSGGSMVEGALQHEEDIVQLPAKTPIDSHASSIRDDSSHGL